MKRRGRWRRKRAGDNYQVLVAVLAEGPSENSLDVPKVAVAEVRGADDDVVTRHEAPAASMHNVLTGGPRSKQSRSDTKAREREKKQARTLSHTE